MGLKKDNRGKSVRPRVRLRVRPQARLRTNGLVRKGMLFLGQAGLIVFVVGLSACTKTLPYKTLLREQVVSKSVIDPSAEYIYAPSTGATSRTVADSGPFFLGQEKVVKLELTRDALQAYEVEMDANYQGNPQNRKLVFEIPISHVEYRCQTDRFGNCRNEEEENNLITWDQKSQFKPDFSRVNVTEVNLLPESIGRLLRGQFCMTEVSSKPLDYNFDKDYINFRIERTMTNDIRCVETLDYLSDLTSSVVSNYSLVKLSTVSTQGYKGLDYPSTDERTFGFFKSGRYYTDVDNVPRTNQEVHLLNRWGPRSEIVYFLSDEFNKPEYESLKKAAYTTVGRINDGLATAGVQFRLRLKDPEGINTGDMRYNMIVLVEDPIAGLLGYGPSVVHPRTGEILTGRAVMYPGNLKWTVQRVYQEILEERQQKSVKGVQNRSFSRNWKKPTDESSPIQSVQFNFDKTVETGGRQKTEDDRGPVLTEGHRKKLLEEVLNASVSFEEKYDPKGGLPVGLDPVDMFMAQRHSCLLRFQEAGGIGGSGSVDPKITKALTEKFGSGELRAWEKLSASEKQFVLDLVMPESFARTLIHELGHNLGLRHNFSASEDKENFYTGEELAQKGIDYVVQSSSVMDYLAGLQGLPVFGKYDIAALRFGYRRELTRKNGTILQIQRTLDEEKKKADEEGKNKDKGLGLKEFQYCTDSGVGMNAGCKRFDSGTTYGEIADGLIRSYNALVKRSAYRRNRANFSLLDLNYAAAVSNIFYDLRTFMEVTERIRYILRLPYDHPEWEKFGKKGGDYDYEDLGFIAEVRQAAVKAGKFLKEVLETPDQTCILGDPAKPGEAPKSYLFSQLQVATTKKKAMRCSELDLSESGLGNRIVIDEVGRPFNDVKSLELENWRVDQIDVRGSWIDKTLAAKYLFARRLQETADQRPNQFDENTDNFADLPELQKDLRSVLLEIMGNERKKEYAVSRLDGQEVRITVPLDVLKTHDIFPQFSSVADFLKVPSGRTSHFIEVFGQQMVRQKKSSAPSSSSAAAVALNDVGIYKTSGLVRPVLPNGAYAAVIGETRYVALENNHVARNYMSEPVVLDTLIEAIEFASLLGGSLEKDKKEALKGIFSPVRKIREEKADPRVVLPRPSAIQTKILGLDDSIYEKLIGRYSALDWSKDLETSRAVLEGSLSREKRVLDMLPVLNEM